MVKRPWAAALTLGIYKLPYPNCLNLAGTSSISKCWGLAEPLQGHYALVWPDYHILRPSLSCLPTCASNSSGSTQPAPAQVLASAANCCPIMDNCSSPTGPPAQYNPPGLCTRWRGEAGNNSGSFRGNMQPSLQRSPRSG